MANTHTTIERITKGNKTLAQLRLLLFFRSIGIVAQQIAWGFPNRQAEEEGREQWDIICTILKNGRRYGI